MKVLMTMQAIPEGWSTSSLRALVVAISLGGLPLLSLTSAWSQQPVRPLPKIGSCPLGYYSSGAYCVPGSSSSTRGAIEKVGSSCPLGFYSSGAYCLSGASQNREAIHKQGSSCPLGWYTSGSYCLRGH